MTRHGAWIALTLLTACSTAPATPPQLTGRWIGPVIPTTTGRLCTPSQGVAQIKNGAVIFAPDEGTWILNGTATPDGILSADKIGQGVNKQPFPTTLEARWTDTTISGTYKTPRCTFDVRLTRR